MTSYPLDSDDTLDAKLRELTVSDDNDLKPQTASDESVEPLSRAQGYVTQVLQGVSSSEAIDALSKTTPEKQEEAVNILMEEEAATYARKATMSPDELRKEGHVDYDLVLESVTDGALPTMKLIRLKKGSTGSPGSRGGGGGKRHLTAGINVLIFEQHENPKDTFKRRRETPRIEHIRGLIATVGPDFYDIVVKKGTEKLVTSGKIQIEGSEMLQVYTRMLRVIKQYKSGETDSADTPFLARVVRGGAPVKVSMDPNFDSSRLNANQNKAMGHALGSDLCLIKGPPGTGKTVVLYQTILQLLRRGETVLICCGSHTAVDNLVQRLDKHADEFPIVRLGHPHRISAAVRHRSLEVQRRTLNRSDQSGLIPARVIAATLHAAYELQDYGPIHTIVIDEACQALQAQCWIPLISNKTLKRLIVAGGDKQLPPTITTQDSQAAETLELSIFDVLLECYGENIMHFLNTQYRMSENIMRFPSDYMYNGLLNAAPVIASQKLYHVPGVTKSPITTPSVLWIDTSLLGYTEESGRKGLISNRTEANLIKDHCLKLQRQGVKLSDIGVISPYVQQKNLIKDLLPAVEVQTIDGFQGQEKNVIVISLVRSNWAATVGFLSDERRMNVAITRAKHQLCIVADKRTLYRCNSPMLNQWAEWCEHHATIVSPDGSGGGLELLD